MPNYEYSCDICGATLERWQRFEDAPLTLCPSCGGSLHRVPHAAGIIFKGSGWYCTDSRGKSKAEPSKAESKCEGCPSKPQPASTTAGASES